MATGFTRREAGAVLGIHSREVREKLNVSVDCIARLYRYDPTRTILMIIEAAKRIEGPNAPQWERRYLRLTDRLNVKELHLDRKVQ